MHILLCAATSFEIQSTLDFVQKKGWQDRIAVLITGVGLLAATYALTKKIAVQKPHLMLQAGIAGSFDELLSLTEVMVVQDDTVGDLGVIESGTFQSLFDMGFQSPNEHPWTKAVLRNPHQYLLDRTGLPQVKSVTINEISTDPFRIHYLKNNFGPTLESMEGAAFQYVALQEAIPFLQLRSVSNYVGERDKTKWNLGGAIESLNRHLQEFLIKTLNA